MSSLRECWLDFANAFQCCLAQMGITKTIEAVKQDATHRPPEKYRLSFTDCLVVCLASIIGSGILETTGSVIVNNTGPAVSLSYFIAVIPVAFTALCYAELAGIMPVTGGAYIFAYTTLGEWGAWIVAWCMTLNFVAGTAGIAVTWSKYFVLLVQGMAFEPNQCNSNGLQSTLIPLQYGTQLTVWNNSNFSITSSVLSIDIPAILVIAFVSMLTLIHLRLSIRYFVKVTILLKCIALIGFIVVGSSLIDVSNYSPFIPPHLGTSFGAFGPSGVVQGASLVFFSYVGFDSITTISQKANHPETNIPWSMLISVAISFILYLGFSVVLSGIASGVVMNDDGILNIGTCLFNGNPGMGRLILISLVIGLPSTMLICLFSQTSLNIALAQDGFLPGCFLFKGEHTRIGVLNAVVTGLISIILAAFLPDTLLYDASSVGSILSYFLSASGVLVLRMKRPDVPRPFMICLGGIIVPVLCVLTTGLVLSSSPPGSIVILLIWIAFGTLLYLFYGRRKSKVWKNEIQRCREGPSQQFPRLSCSSYMQYVTLNHKNDIKNQTSISTL